MQITDKDLQQFRERAKTELQSNGAVGRLAWDAVVNALCNEVEELRKYAAPGNAAALREALRECRDELYEIQGMSELDDTRIALLRQNSNAALTAPPEPLCNAAALREALENAISVLRDDLPTPRDISRAFAAASAALAAPARNCDVGTAEEQAERFKQFCLDNHSAEHLCSRCPLGKQLGNDVDMCQLHWAQMPYAPAQGGAKCVNGLRGEPDCRGCNEHCEDVRKRNCFYWNPDIEGGVCALTGKKSCPISCDNFHVAKEEKPAPAKGGKE